MKTRFEKTLDVDHNTFSSWDTASTHTVDKIFSFSEECGNDHILDVINNVSRYIENNQYLVPLALLNHTHASQYIEYLKTLINFYIDYEMNTIDPQFLTEDLVKFNDSKQVHQAMFLLASHCAISLFKILSEDEQYASFKNTSMSYFLIARTVVNKQKDYGPENISKFGMWGIVVRLHDKIARLDNLLSKKRSGFNSVNDETVYDTLMDIVGYSTVAIMWTNSWFRLPLDIDLKW
jgi:hypothetical protein